MEQKREVTIHDIARRLKVSSATVSRALRDNPAITRQTRARVQEAARQLGYRHNIFASSLRKQQTNTIGIIVHELNSHFITSVLTGIEKVTSAAGYDLIIAHSAESYKKEVANVTNLFHKRVDGLIASLACDTNRLDHYALFEDKGIPVVFFDRVEETVGSTRVIIDNYTCGYLATQHLIEQGCRRIALVTANLERNVYQERFQGYQAALTANGLLLEEKLVLIRGLQESCGREAAAAILQMAPLPDGVFITNDFTASVCLQHFKQHGLRIPADIAIVGFNNDVIGRLVEPALTTIDYCGEEMGEQAARSLIEHLQAPAVNVPATTISIRSQLIVRESSLKKPHAS
ncbi:LacI family DNA-binding transcriptional regulator [Paraflavitalea pollutisoli]|uniref:LacI family DNA-binding transcriptional regulator n=1 Tax=Paraflavitalea pollutisoli TaxID=3034143 RepID=UPI0023EDC4E3|nr:LacI family DNA-binding transcriptional regulator [Paraflavitalea sp. H1-2-19X]